MLKGFCMSDLSLSRGSLPLTLPQLDFWEEFTFHPDEAVSTVAHYLDIEGDVDERALIRAIERTIAESDVLSLRFEEGEAGEDPRQICDAGQFPTLECVDLRGTDRPLQEALARMEADVQAKIDLRTDKLAAQSLFRVSEQRYIWYIRAHHIIIDGYGFALIEQRCGQYYRYFRGLAEIGHAFHPFVSFLEEEEAYRQSPRWQADRAYWNDYLAHHGDLPVMHKGVEDYGTHGEHLDLSVPDTISLRLRECAAMLDIGWPDLLVLLSGAYLYHRMPKQQVEGQHMLPLWLPFMSRWGSVGAHMPGMLVNILPFHVTLGMQESLRAYLTRSVAALKKQRKHGRYRIEQIATDQNVAKGSRFYFSPLINVLPFSAPQFDGCRVSRHVLANGPAEGFSITYRAEDDGSNMTLQIDRDPSVTGMDNAQDIIGFLSEALSRHALDQPVRALLAGLRVEDAA
jgi:enterobactin synthetase component F